METIQQFAERHKVRIKRDSCNDDIITGKEQHGDACLARLISKERVKPRQEHRSHIFDGFNNQFGLCLMLATKMRWTHAKKKLTAAGFVIRQDGDTEGVAMFDPANAQQARLALKLAKVKTRRKREFTPEQRRAIGERLRAGRTLATAV